MATKSDDNIAVPKKPRGLITIKEPPPVAVRPETRVKDLDNDESGDICACGKAVGAEEVYAEVFPGSVANPNPQTLPFTPDANGDWQILQRSGAACAASPGADNVLRVWAKFAGDDSLTTLDRPFKGVCSNQTECEADPTCCP